MVVVRGIAVIMFVVLFTGAKIPIPPPSARIPINDLGTGLYLGQFQGGLYEGGSNNVPTDHAARATSATRQIQRLDTNGNPSPNGRILLVSTGMSNASQEWCSGADPPIILYEGQFWGGLAHMGANRLCKQWTLGGQAWNDGTVEKDALEIVDGA